MLWRFWLPTSCWTCWMYWKTYFEGKWSINLLNSWEPLDFKTTSLLFEYWCNGTIFRGYFVERKHLQWRSNIFNFYYSLCKHEKIFTRNAKINLFASFHVSISNSNFENSWTVFKTWQKIGVVYGFTLQLRKLYFVKLIIY